MTNTLLQKCRLSPFVTVHVSVAMTASSAATLNGNNPCDDGDQASATMDVTHSGLLRAGSSDKIVSFKEHLQNTNLDDR